LSKFIPFTEKEIYVAAHTEIKSILDAKGEKSERSGTEWMWAANHSVKFRGHIFYDHSTGDKGTAIDFLCTFFNMRFQDAVCTLNCRDYNGIEFERSTLKKERERRPFVLPGKSRNMKRVYAYLMQERCIDSEVISFFVHNRSLYESANTHNAVFVGYDSTGKARAAHQKGTLTEKPYRGDVDGSEKDFFFNYHGGSERLYVFEAPIDMLSFITLHKEKGWQNHNYLALGCTASPALLRFLSEYPNVHQVVLCLDNDEAGVKADPIIQETLQRLSEGMYVEDLSDEIREQLRRLYEISILKSVKKDWNDDLKNRK